MKYQIINFANPYHAKTVRTVLERFGRESEDFDLMWSYKYPFGEQKEGLRNLKIHQKYNHFPFITFLTAKSYLATHVDSEYIPKAFRIPQDREEFQSYVTENPEKRFVVKSVSNRGVKLMQPSEINFEDQETFIQEFVEDPLLIDGYVFDLGVFAVITSLDPIRLYIFDKEVLVRFCSEQYHPLDPENIEKYVIHENQKNVWTVPSTAKYYKGFRSTKMAMETHLLAEGYNVTWMWEQIEDVVVSMVLGTEGLIVENVSKLTKFSFSNCQIKKKNFDSLKREILTVWKRQILTV